MTENKLKSYIYYLYCISTKNKEKITNNKGCIEKAINEVINESSDIDSFARSFLFEGQVQTRPQALIR